MTISTGPTFKGALSSLGGFISLATLMFILGSTFGGLEASGIHFILMFLFFVVGILMFLSLGGVEIDQEQRRFRLYRQPLGFRIGQWQSIDNFDILCLSKQFNRMGGNAVTGNGAHSAGSFELNIASHNNR